MLLFLGLPIEESGGLQPIGLTLKRLSLHTCMFLVLCVCAHVHTCGEEVLAMSDSVTPWTVASQAPLSMGFSRREYWSELPCPPPGDLPDPGIEPRSPALQAESLLLSHWGSPCVVKRTGVKVLGTQAPTLTRTTRRREDRDKRCRVEASTV